MRATQGSAGILGPHLVVVVVRAAFTSKAVGHHAGHVGLEGKRDEVHHQLDVFLHAVLHGRLKAHTFLVKLRSTFIDDTYTGLHALFHLADGGEVLLHALTVGLAKLALETLDVAYGGVEHAAIERNAGLGFLNLCLVGRRKEAAKHCSVIGGSRDVRPHGVTGERGGANAVVERQCQ